MSALNRGNHPALRTLGLTGFAVLWVVTPLWLLIVNSVKTQGDASVLSLAWPARWSAGANYSTVINKGHYLEGLGNSLVTAVPTILVVLFLGSMAAWTYTRSSRRSLQFAYRATVMSALLPVAVLPTVYLVTRIGLSGSRLGYVLALGGTRIGVAVFLLGGSIRAIPRETEEAAFVDGASRFQVYRHIVLPMVRPALVVAAVVLAISIWNDFALGLYLLSSPTDQTLPLTLYQFASSTQYTLQWNLVFAHVVLTNLPLLLVYAVLQRRFTETVAQGALGG